MTNLLRLPGVLCDADDILVSRKDAEEHEGRLQAVLSQLKAAEVTLNKLVLSVKHHFFWPCNRQKWNLI